MLSNQEPTNTTATTSSRTGSSAGAADAARFPTRLTGGRLDRFFSALATEFQSTRFIDLLKKALEPLIPPSAQDQTQTTTDTGTAGSA